MADVEYVTTAELSAYPGVAAPRKTIVLVQTIINGMVNEIVGQLDPIPYRVKAIALDAAADRLAGNSDGAQQVTVQIDDFKETRIWPDGAASRGDIGFSAGQVRDMKIAAGLLTSRRSRSIRLRVPHESVAR